jgi:dipeptidyl aminopeptidase/acylaminoacyl peptidase/CubicO group peptidase (beta-lactamase class C family)
MPIAHFFVSRIGLCLALLVYVLAASAQEQRKDQVSTDFSVIERAAAEEMLATKTPGAAIAIVRGGQIIWAKGLGVANVETQQAVTPEMLFRIGSTTKMFTAAALVTLAEEGKLRLDEPIGNSVPHLHPQIAALAAHQLLTHTAGLTDESIMSGLHDESALAAGIRQMDERWLFTTPGSIYSYANPGYWIAGLACEQLAGRPYAEVMDERLFQPLGMVRTTLRPTLAMTWPLALGHEVRNGQPAVVRPQADNAATWPAGQMYSNVLELARFTTALMDDGRLDGKQVLSTAVVKKLSTPYVPRPGDGGYYGYGLAIGEERGVMLWQHGGSRSGYGSTIRMAPEHRVAVIILTNRSGSSLSKTAMRALEAVLPLKPEEPDAERSARERQPLSELEIADLAGTYSNHRQTIELHVEGGKLHARRSGGEGLQRLAGEVFKTSDRLVVTTSGSESNESRATLVLVRDKDGKSEYLISSGRALKKVGGASEVARHFDPDIRDKATSYQKPPKEISDILDVPPTPQVMISPTRDWLLLVERQSYPPIADLAAPMLRLAGLRINPRTNGPHMASRNTGLMLKSIANGNQRRVELPKGANIGTPNWSPDGKRLAMTITTPSGIELWIATVADGAARQLKGITINAAYGDAVQWMPDSRVLLVQTVVGGRGEPPVPPQTPPGPTIQESFGRAGPARTYQDLLQNAHDERLFDYYCTSQLALVDAEGGDITAIGQPGIFAASEPSPDGKHLLVIRNQRPYSYVHPVSRFPKQVEVWDRGGRVEHTLASLPLQDSIPIDGVATGPRSYQWRPTEPATLVWVEALDEGDPRKTVPHRDRVLMLEAPFAGHPTEIAKTQQRFSGITWGEKDGLALLRDYDRDRRWTRTFAISASRPTEPVRLLWERSTNDRYGDPGTPMMRPLASGRRVIWQQGESIFLDGNGATPRGDRPFLDRFNLQTGKSERLFRCDDASYESVVALLTDDGSQFITRHETPDQPPNYFVVGRTTGPSHDSRRKLTDFPDPMPQLRQIKKQLVTYQRADGVQLSFTLYLPPAHKPGERLPTVIWAYPREFNDAGTAGQVSGSTNRFTSIGGTSHLFFLTQGYAILDGATMPVVGDPASANNTYIEQIVASAAAAIDKAVEMGVTDRSRVGVGGHSYGAFMTANLLAHSDLFRAGIARSGAYNRTLTPFGFQNERRTLWEAAETYFKMSPFLAADKIKEPILLIHGEADNNPGTFPIQSQRLYEAIRGNGGNVRYVTLPHESHGYAARESVEHTLYEMVSWFDQHVKNATLTSVPGGR